MQKAKKHNRKADHSIILSKFMKKYLNLMQNRSYWKALALWAILRLVRLDSSKYIVELGHVLDEGVWMGLKDFGKIRSLIGSI